MAVTPYLTSVRRLSVMLYKDADRIPQDDEYALMMIGLASNAVREAARQAGWVVETDEGDLPGVGQALAPQTARDIALLVAGRAYTNPKNLERRTAGPISETFRDSGVFGVGLTEDERNRLNDVSGRTGGIWVQPIEYGSGEPLTVLVPTLTANPIIASDIGPFPLGQEDQFPYASPEYQVVIDPDM